MKTRSQILDRALRLALGAILTAAISGAAWGDEIKVALIGGQEIPPVTTAATGAGVITVEADRSVSGRVAVTGMVVTVAHIHEAPPGGNGPIIIPLVMAPDNVWMVPAGARLTDAQYESYKAGNLYFNVHSDTYKKGEIRGQIKP